jgi:hypothetical protein
MIVHDLDDIAGFSGFGQAMLESGWMIERGDNSLVFPNFLEFNEPACLRKRPKSTAERQRAWRARTAEQNNSVTKVTKRNDREEKRRVDNKKENIKRKKPTLEEVHAYCLERSNGIDAQGFLDYYEANGWVQGKSRKPIVDWKAAIRTFERNGRAQQRCQLPTADELARYNPVTGIT